jgi:hypothetical protein
MPALRAPDVVISSLSSRRLLAHPFTFGYDSRAMRTAPIPPDLFAIGGSLVPLCAVPIETQQENVPPRCGLASLLTLCVRTPADLAALRRAPP